MLSPVLRGEVLERIYLDISQWQKNIKYSKVKTSGIDGVMLRGGYTGYGENRTLNKDALFDTHYNGFTKEGIPVGVYWYSCALTSEEAENEAAMVLKLIKTKKISLPIVWDTEDPYWQRNLSKSSLTACAKTFCNKIEDAGYYAMIYASLSWFNNRLKLDQLDAYDKWVAAWGTEKPAMRCGIWQYTSKGKVAGINGYVDKNKAFYDYVAVIKKAGLNQLK